MRYESKQELQDDIRSSHDQLCAMLAELPEDRNEEGGVWGDAWTIVDLVTHLAEWQSMFLRWYDEGSSGNKPHMPVSGYKWNETPRLNRDIREKYRSRSMAKARAEFDSSYRRIAELVDELSADALLKPGHFDWTGKYPLTTYLGPNTASHYRFAIKVIRRWRRLTS